MSEQAVAGPSSVEFNIVKSVSISDEEFNELDMKQKRKQGRNWMFVRKFSNIKDAELFIKYEEVWSSLKEHTTREGVKRYYRCNKVKCRGAQCSAAIYLLLDSSCDSVLLYRTEADHDHDEVKSLSTRRIPAETCTEIDRLLEMKLKPKAIMNALTKIEGLHVPSRMQLKNYLSKIRQEKQKQYTISLRDLKALLVLNSQPPEDSHAAFVVSFEVSDDEKDPYFRFILSTKYLLRLACGCRIIHVDATKKLTWQGFPILIVGTTDCDRNFHPFALSVTSSDQTNDIIFIFTALKNIVSSLHKEDLNPEVLISDASNSIQNAFLVVFGPKVIRICWAHVKRNIQKRIGKLLDNSLQKQILSDIEALQCSSSSDVFDQACKSFLVKWKDHHEFIKYFQDDWVNANRNWYLGVLPGTPATNHALDAFIQRIKDENNLRERQPLSSFLLVTKDMVSHWSNSYLVNKSVSRQPTITLKQWTEAYQWAKLPKKLQVKETTDSTTYYRIPAGENMECPTFDTPWESFDEFKQQYFSEFEVLIPNCDWRTGSCTCPTFLKEYVCQHLLGAAIRLKYVKPPAEARLTPEKRKRGRPAGQKNGKRALLI